MTQFCYAMKIEEYVIWFNYGVGLKLKVGCKLKSDKVCLFNNKDWKNLVVRTQISQLWGHGFKSPQHIVRV